MSRPSPRREALLFVPLVSFLVAAELLSAGTARAAEDAEPLARTAQVTDAREQLDFGVKMARRGLWSEALFRFQQAAKLDPGNPRVLNNIAVSYEALGQFDRALESYRAAIQADPANRDLKKNYSRFVEFYRAFRPDEQKDASVAERSPEAQDGETVASHRAGGEG